MTQEKKALHDSDPHSARRLDDKIKTVGIAFSVLCGPLAVFLLFMFYANIPKELASFRETYVRESAVTQATLQRLTEVTGEQTEVLKGMASLKERMALLEQAQKQHGDALVRVDRRLDKLEDRPGSLFGGGSKK